jgi:hypothetical protein
MKLYKAFQGNVYVQGTRLLKHFHISRDMTKQEVKKGYGSSFPGVTQITTGNIRISFEYEVRASTVLKCSISKDDCHGRDQAPFLELVSVRDNIRDTFLNKEEEKAKLAIRSVCTKLSDDDYIKAIFGSYCMLGHLIAYNIPSAIV